MESKFETLKEIDEYESKNALTDEERRALFERRMQIFFRIRDWREENKKLGLEPTISDDWSPQQRESFLRDWFDDDLINMEASCSEEMMNEVPFVSESMNEGASTSQQGRGEKKMHDEVDEDEEDERPYAIENVKEVNIKKFRTKGTNYTLRFNNIMADVEIKDIHERLHDVFQHVLDDTVGNVPSRNQVRMVIHSTQLEYPIAFPFKPAQALTTERILSEVQRVVQSNQHFRLNDTVDVNVIHVSMPLGGKGRKRTEMNLEKHLEKKRAVVRIQNTDDLCMARALVVAKAKIDEDPQYKSIVDHRRPMQTRMAQELQTNAAVPLGPCGIEEAKQFQAYLAEYQINIVSKEYNNRIIYSGPDKDKKIYLYMHNNHYDVITKMPGVSLPAHTTVTSARKHTIMWRNTFVQIRANVAGLVPFALSCLGCPVTIVVECSKVNNVTISTKSPGAKLGPCVRDGSNAPNARNPFGCVRNGPKSTIAERISAGSVVNMSSSKITFVLFNPKPRKEKESAL